MLIPPRRARRFLISNSPSSTPRTYYSSISRFIQRARLTSIGSISIFLERNEEGGNLGVALTESGREIPEPKWIEAKWIVEGGKEGENGEKDIRALTYGWRNCRRGGGNNIYRRLG